MRKATAKKGDGVMRRILSLLMVALIVAVVAVATAAPAFAAPPYELGLKKMQLIEEGGNVPKPCGPLAG
jgi:hypothetical protein